MNARWPIRCCGTGRYVPEEVLTNRHFESYLDTTNEWIVTRTGIRERRRAAAHETTSTMAAIAARRALEDAGMSIADIVQIIFRDGDGRSPLSGHGGLCSSSTRGRQHTRV
jgi:3-oxoacyl-[acyl-carrier-protein] synthase-3